MAIWITSDLHLNHYNILQLEHNNLIKNGLGYIDTVEKYNNMIINRINSVVRYTDTLYILGDVAFGGFDIIKPLISRINGHKIMIMGNHEHYSVADGLKLGYERVYKQPIYLPGCNGKVILSHYPVKEAYNNPYIVYNLHGHLHDSYLNLPNYLNMNIAMNHYYPVKLDSLMKNIESNGKNRQEAWLDEWYAADQVFPDGHNHPDLVLKTNGQIDLEATRQKHKKTQVDKE